MEKYSCTLKVPKERIAVLIGKEGEIKRQIEENTKTKLKIDSEDGEVLISGKDALDLYAARETIKAIGRGFNPEIAQLLLKQDYCFILLNLSELCKPSDIKRVKGRIIGEEGRSRKTLEVLSECNISVYGKTVAIIGLTENTLIAKHAIESLIRGSPHSKVYSYLERQRGEMKSKGEMI